MKMFYKIFISCIFLWIGNICHAQKGLAIAPLFSGKYDKDEQAIVVLLKGKTLHPYGLSLFHSISITDRPDDVTLFEAAVSTDSRKAENSETVIPLPDITSYHLPSPMEKTDLFCSVKRHRTMRHLST